MDPIEWLLEPENPSVRYRTLVELLDRGGSEEALEAKRAIAASSPVLKLLQAMHPDGYWLQKNPRTGQTLGDGAEYGCFGTTHFCLSYCAELGLDRTHPLVAKAAERYLSLQGEDGTGGSTSPACTRTTSEPSSSWAIAGIRACKRRLT